MTASTNRIVHWLGPMKHCLPHAIAVVALIVAIMAYRRAGSAQDDASNEGWHGDHLEGQLKDLDYRVQDLERKLRP